MQIILTNIRAVLLYVLSSIVWYFIPHNVLNFIYNLRHVHVKYTKMEIIKMCNLKVILITADIKKDK